MDDSLSHTHRASLCRSHLRTEIADHFVGLVRLVETEEMADKAYEGANRWTDNVFMLQKWCEKSMDPGELKSGFKQLGCVCCFFGPPGVCLEP